MSCRRRAFREELSNVNVTNGSLPVSGTVNVGNVPAVQNVSVVSTPAPPAGRLISLGTQTASNRYRSAFVDVSDCDKATIMTTVYPWDFPSGTPGFVVNLQISPDEVQAISANPGTASEDVIDGVKSRSINNFQVVWPYLRVEAYLNPAETTTITA